MTIAISWKKFNIDHTVMPIPWFQINSFVLSKWQVLSVVSNVVLPPDMNSLLHQTDLHNQFWNCICWPVEYSHLEFINDKSSKEIDILNDSGEGIDAMNVDIWSKSY